MSRLAAHGVSVDVPAGWEAELSTQPDPVMLDPGLESSDASLVVVHAANFSLPAERGDYGSGAVEIMDRGGIFAALIEFDRASASSKLFAHEGFPTRLRTGRFRARPVAPVAAGPSRPPAVLPCGVAGVLPLRGDRVVLDARTCWCRNSTGCCRV